MASTVHVQIINFRSLSLTMASFNVRSHTEKYHLKNYSIFSLIFCVVVCAYMSLFPFTNAAWFFFSHSPKKFIVLVVSSSCLLFINTREKGKRHSAVYQAPPQDKHLVNLCAQNYYVVFLLSHKRNEFRTIWQQQSRTFLLHYDRSAFFCCFVYSLSLTLFRLPFKCKIS